MTEAVRENGTLGLNWIVSPWIPAFAGMTNFGPATLSLNHQPVPGRELGLEHLHDCICNNRWLFDR